MKVIFGTIKFIFELAFFITAGFVMLFVAYYFGWSLLPGEVQWGNDIPSAMNNVYYLEAWYPPIPNWIHLWAGGMPFLRLYPAGPFLLTFFIHKFTALSVYQVAKLVMFFSIPLAALGVAALGRVLTRNWIVGILAGVIMILLPDSWFWATVGGFYAMASAVPFYAWTMVFFSLAMKRKSLIFSILSAIFYGLTWYFHPNAGVLAGLTMVILGLGFGVQNFGLRQSWKGLFSTLAIIALGVLLFAWWILPFLTRETIGGIGISAKDMYRVSFGELLGFEKPATGVYVTSTLFNAGFIALFVLGTFVSLFRAGIIRWAVLACAVALFIMTAPGYAQPIVKAFNLFWLVTNIRAALIIRVLGAIVAAYGAASVIRPLFWLIERFIKRLRENKFWWFSTETMGGITGVLLLVIVLKTIVILPPLEGVDLKYSGYGPYRNWIALKEVDGKIMARDSNTKTFRYILFKDPSTVVKEIPGIFSMVGGGHGLLTQQIEAIVKIVNPSSKERIDISPLEGQFAGSLGNVSQVGQIQAYFGSSLIQPMVGWQISCVYYDPLCKAEDIKNLYQWFGVSQVWRGMDQADAVSVGIGERLSKLEFLEPETIHIDIPDEASIDWKIFHLKEPNGLASITNKPTILIIGDNPPNNDVYSMVFKVLPRIGWGYDRAWTVDGSQKIDDYSLEQLKQYKAIILHGYRYNSKNSWQKLEKYVQGGGRVLINTGWKYFAQDWGRESKESKEKFVNLEMPAIFPVKQTTWTSLGKNWSDLSSEVTQENLSNWAELTWEGYDWSMAVAKKEWVKPGARIVLSAGENVLMAEQAMGGGKILWTGFDFIGHLSGKRSENEEKFLDSALISLMGETTSEEKRLDFDRIRPDLIKITYSQLPGENKLMFKEVAASGWKANLTSEGIKTELPIFKAGPGWKMVLLPEGTAAQGQITLSYHTDNIKRIGYLTTFVGILAALIYSFLTFTKKNWKERLAQKAKGLLSGRLEKAKEEWEDEDQ